MMLKVTRRIIRLLCIGLMLRTGYSAHAAPSHPLPPSAQEAVNQGKLAHEREDHLGAIDHFREALRFAPKAPEVLFRLGREESRIPGRELRAMAWLGAYLSARTDAPDAVDVHIQIDKLKRAHQQTLSRVLRAAENAAKASHVHSVYLGSVAKSWAAIGDLKSAREMAAFIENQAYKDPVYGSIALAQAGSGDVAGARTTIELIQDAEEKHFAQKQLVQIQAEAGDIKGAQTTWNAMAILAKLSWAELGSRPSAASFIAKAQTKEGDRAGARETMRIALKRAEVIEETQWDSVHSDIAEAQARDGDFIGAQKTVQRMKDPERKADTHAWMAHFEAEAGNSSKALEMAESIAFAYEKDKARAFIAEVQAKRGNLAGARRTARLIRDESWKAYARKAIAKAEGPKPANGDGVSVENWLGYLDTDDPASNCALMMRIFLDQPAYLKALPLSDDPEKLAAEILRTVDQMLLAQRTLENLFERAAATQLRHKPHPAASK